MVVWGHQGCARLWEFSLGELGLEQMRPFFLNAAEEMFVLGRPAEMSSLAAGSTLD